MRDESQSLQDEISSQSLFKKSRLLLINCLDHLKELKHTLNLKKSQPSETEPPQFYL